MTRLLITTALASLLAACASTAPTSMKVDNSALPEAVRVPAGHTAFMSSTGKGDLTYECRAKKDAADAFEWAFIGPVATLHAADGQSVGRYYAGPTWESTDGSKVTGKQVAVAPHKAGSIPLQLVRAEPAVGMGAMQSVTYIQRLNTQGGVAPSAPCGREAAGQRMVVPYAADYVFYRAG